MSENALPMFSSEFYGILPSFSHFKIIFCARRIIHRPLAEMLLVALLHLNNEGAPIGTLAGDIENHLSVLLAQPKMFSRDKIDVNDLHIFQKHVQEPDKHILVGLASKQPLKHKITQKLSKLLSSSLLLISNISHVHKQHLVKHAAKFRRTGETVFKKEKNLFLNPGNSSHI